jgi:hypothetical protein
VTGASSGLLDYYAVLQVRPDADQEVIDAAYRGLMKKYHPDLAGDDPRAIQEHLARAKGLNEAYSVLRDPARRKRYDEVRYVRGWNSRTTDADASVGTAGPAAASGARPSSASPPRGEPSTPPPPQPGPPPEAPPQGTIIVPPKSSGLPGPLALLGAAYYLLPGPYEWEEGTRKELLTVGLLPVAGLATFALVTGRLDPWIGHSLNATLLAWGLIVLLFLPMLTSLPRVAMAGVPSLVLLTGAAAPVLAQAHVPVWFAWGIASLLSVMLAARMFVFGVLPTVAICWLIVHLS